MNADDVNPFLFTPDDANEQETLSTKMGNMLERMNFALRKYTNTNVAPPREQPERLIIHTPGAPISGGCGCGCRALVALFMAMFIVIGILILVLVTITNKFSTLEYLGVTATSLLTRYAAIQQRHTVEAYFDVYGDEPSSLDVRVETTNLKSFARIVGSVELASQRIDWNVRVNDAHQQFGTHASLALWVQEYDPVAHLMRHVASSPFVLCRNVTLTQPCMGHMDRPDAELSARDELNPHVLSLAVYKSPMQANRTSIPGWLVSLY